MFLLWFLTCILLCGSKNQRWPPEPNMQSDWIKSYSQKLMNDAMYILYEYSFDIDNQVDGVFFVSLRNHL